MPLKKIDQTKKNIKNQNKNGGKKKVTTLQRKVSSFKPHRGGRKPTMSACPQVKDLAGKQTKKKTTKRKSQKGGSSLPNVAVSTINSMINLGKSIFNEMDAVMNMGNDFNKASNVQLPNQTTPDQAITSQTQTMKYPTMPKAKV